MGYGVLRGPPSDCSKCGSSLKASVYNGKPGLVCSNQKCRKRVHAAVGGLLEGSKLSLKEFVLIAYMWAHDSAGTRAVHMLGHATNAEWSSRFRVCVMNYEASRGEVLGGPDVEVEADESELGRKKKALHGHYSTVLGDVRGVFERGTGQVVLELYEKLHSA